MSKNEFALPFGITANAAAFRDRWNAINAGTFTGMQEFVDEIVTE